MTDTTTTSTPPAPPAPMTAAQAAKAVKRTVTVTAGDKTRTTRVPVAEEEVLAFVDYGTHVVVVTVDGQKFSSKAEV